jgi:hypothetical protein
VKISESSDNLNKVCSTYPEVGRRSLRQPEKGAYAYMVPEARSEYLWRGVCHQVVDKNVNKSWGVQVELRHGPIRCC